MPDNTSQYSTVVGEAFNIKSPDSDKTNFAVRSFVTGSIINCTLWANSHGHVSLNQGDAVIVNGKVKKTPKKDGDGHWVNLSVSKIGVIPMDAGVDTRNSAPAAQRETDSDLPDVM